MQLWKEVSSCLLSMYYTGRSNRYRQSISAVTLVISDWEVKRIALPWKAKTKNNNYNHFNAFKNVGRSFGNFLLSGSTSNER